MSTKDNITSRLQNTAFTRRGFIGGASAAGLVAMLSGCTGSSSGSDSGSSDGSSSEAVIDGVNLDLVPATTPQFAFMQGTWKEMGVQLAKEFPEELKCAINLSVSTAMSSLSDYSTLKDRYEPYRDVYDKWFDNEDDGKLTDLAEGIAEELGLDFWQVGCLFFPASPEGEVPTDESSDTGSSDERDCSAAIAWGKATADGATGCISIMDADIDVQDLHYMPVTLFKPNHGNLYACMNGIFGSVANHKGLAIQSPGGSSDMSPSYGTFPHMWVAAYCDNVDEAVDFMGDPEGSQKKWVPLVSDYNMMMCDADGNALDYQVSNWARAIRKNGDVKMLSEADGDVMPQETSTYLLTNNLYLSEPMLSHVLSNVQRDIDVYWDDVEPRYWTVDKVLSDAAANGGITLDTLAEAEGETRYYVPEGWDYDYYPDWKLGRWVPTSIYDKLDEDGGLTRAEYYGDCYDPDKWGEPMSKEESRKVEAWAAGWHEPSWSATPAVSTMGYWSPTPVSDVDKNGSRDLFDSNTRTLYYMNGSSSRTLSNTVDATGTYAIVRFPEEINDGDDIQATMVASAVSDLKEQLWLAARDMDERGVDVDTADGQVIEGYLDDARKALYRGMNYQAQGINETETDAKLVAFTKAMCELQKGICMAQLAQTEPGKIIKDLGDSMVDVKNLETSDK